MNTYLYSMEAAEEILLEESGLSPTYPTLYDNITHLANNSVEEVDSYYFYEVSTCINVPSDKGRISGISF